MEVSTERLLYCIVETALDQPRRTYGYSTLWISECYANFGNSE